ncbi:MAG: hypothetical protein OER86_09390 [Phycisphaerae bacterium]|nr:hypothetical protein [Phycisphaerae bacterium]
MHHRSTASAVLVLASAGLAPAADGFKDTAGSHLDILHDDKPLVR